MLQLTMKPSKLKTTLAALRSFLTTEEEITVSQKDRKSGAFIRVPKKIKVPLLTKEQVANWFECSVSKVEHIESGDPRLPLRPEDAQTLAAQTSVSFKWLMGGDPKKPIVNGYGEPYTKDGYKEHRAE